MLDPNSVDDDHLQHRILVLDEDMTNESVELLKKILQSLSHLKNLVYS